MKKYYFVCLKLVFGACMVLSFCAGCGSSSGGSNPYADIDSAEYAVVTLNGTVVINTETSEMNCVGDDCYRFSTSYYRTGSQTFVEVAESSGRGFSLEFISDLDGVRAGTVFTYRAKTDFASQDLYFYATYNSPGLPCVQQCANVYNYSDTATCDPYTDSCKYYQVAILENSSEALIIDFYMWNKYFLPVSQADSEGNRSGTFRGQIKVDKRIHTVGQALLYGEE